MISVRLIEVGTYCLALWSIQRFAILLSLISTCVAMLEFREQAAQLIIMSCGMRTSLQLMSCRL
jgi:hypothetical protein